MGSEAAGGARGGIGPSPPRSLSSPGPNRLGEARSRSRRGEPLSLRRGEPLPWSRPPRFSRSLSRSRSWLSLLRPRCFFLAGRRSSDDEEDDDESESELDELSFERRFFAIDDESVPARGVGCKQERAT